jgi:peptide-methionine (S)-S-oxide reductase
VVRTRVGYAGGSSISPTYYNLDGHSETIQIDYDPTKVTYEELLEVFWDSHNPAALPWSRQYMSIIFYHNDEQRQIAVSSKDREAARLGRNIVTEIVPFSGFYLAEGYHQKYYLRQEPGLFQELNAIYPDTGDFTDSKAVARLNGYVGGYGMPETLEKELDSLGLSEAGKMRLLEIAGRGLVSGCAVP